MKNRLIVLLSTLCLALVLTAPAEAAESVTAG